MTNVFAIGAVVIKELYRRKDFYVLFVLTALITLLLGSASFFGDTSIVRYITEVCMLLIWVSLLVIGVATAARQIPAERENRTILPLLAKPVTRGQLIAGKFLGSWQASGLALLVFYLFLTVVVWARSGGLPWATYLQAAWLHWMCLAVVISMALLGSIIFSAPSATTTIVLVVAGGILMLGRYLNLVAEDLAEPARTVVYALYYVLPHLEWYDLREFVVHQHPRVPWWAVGVATIYATMYAAVFLGLAWLAFRRKPLTNA